MESNLIEGWKQFNKERIKELESLNWIKIANVDTSIAYSNTPIYEKDDVKIHFDHSFGTLNTIRVGKKLYNFENIEDLLYLEETIWNKKH